MTTPKPNWPSQIRRQSTELSRRWQACSQRERRLMTLCLVAFFALLLWLFAIQPALKIIEQANTELASLRVDAARVSTIALEAHTLRERHAHMAALNQTHTGTRNSTVALQTSLERFGLSPSVSLDTPSADSNTTTHTDTAHRFTLQVDQANASSLINWLVNVVPTLEIHVHTLELQRSVVESRERPGLVTGQIVLHEVRQP